MTSHNTGYAVGIAAFFAGMTLNEWAAIAGIVGVVITVFFGWRRDRRETIAHEIVIGKRPDRRDQGAE